MYISILISLAAIILSIFSIITNRKTAQLQEEHKLLLRATMYDVAGVEEDVNSLLSREGK